MSHGFSNLVESSLIALGLLYLVQLIVGWWICRHEPRDGIELSCKDSLPSVLLITSGPDKGCLFFKHPDGQWVKTRKATQADLDIIQRAIMAEQEEKA